MQEILDMLGPFPNKVELNPEIVEETDCGSYIRQKVKYNVETGERISAYICLPKNKEGLSKAIFCYHQHHGQFELGKSEVMGLTGDPNQAYAKELAERGYITFAPDAIAFEERQAGGQYYELASRLVQGKTLLAKVIHDTSVGLDYLCSRSEIDMNSIGLIGHSYGGRMALWMPAFDSRIKASVSNCGCIDYHHSLTADTGIQMEFCVPGFMKKFDLEDIIEQAKSCPMLISATTDDKWSRGYQELYGILEARGLTNVELKVYPGAHIFSLEMREYAYKFLDNNLGRINE